MRISKAGLFAISGLALLALAGCGEEDTAATQDNPPAAAEGDSGTERSATEDAAQKIREAAEATAKAAREQAGRIAEQGRQALEDAGPALKEAGEIAGQIGSSLNEIAQQAMKDFDKGVDLLEQRINEATGEKEPVTGDPDAVLSPADQLRADTRAAARAGPAGVGPDYVGAWATDAASCAKIDQDPVEVFAVITTTTIRRYENVCNFPATEMDGKTVTLAASCIAEGNTEERQIMLEMPTQDTLKIGTADNPGAAELVRCHLPN